MSTPPVQDGTHSVEPKVDVTTASLWPAATPDLERNSLEEKPVIVSARDWAIWRKVSIVAFVSTFAFLSTLAASIIAPSHDKIQADLQVSQTVSILPVSLFNIGMAAGPVIGSPASESVGRQPVYLTSMPLLLVFTLASSFSHTLPSLLVCRFFSGVCASTGVTLASATIADLFERGNARRYALFSYYSMPWLGATLGPLVGSLVLTHKPWEWTLWVYLMIAVPIVVPGLLFMSETKLSVIEARAQTKTTAYLNSAWLKSQFHQGIKGIPAFLQKSLGRPLQMLFTELIVTVICIYAGFSFGLIYALVVALPHIYRVAYNFDKTQQGLAFLPLIGGVIAGPLTMMLYTMLAERSERRKKATSKEDAEDAKQKPAADAPESRLKGAMIGGVMLPCALLWFAWTARSDVHYLCPMFASIFITYGSRMVYVSNSAYMTDVYGPVYAASAQAASTFVRYSMAAGIPLFVLQMYEALGIGWATSVIAACAILMMPIPFIFYRWGPWLRSRCKYQTES